MLADAGFKGEKARRGELRKKETMDKITKNSGGTTMVESFREALKKARDLYEASLKSMNPTSHYNKEANLTTFFLKAIETVDSPLKGAVSYDEFPVARHFRPGKENDPKGNHKSDSLDSVLYQQEANRLYILEAKEKAKPWNSISWDIIRAQNVVGSDEVFPHALKDANGNELALKYADTDVYGLVLCGYWTKTGLDSAKKEFVDGLNESDDPSLAKEGHVVKTENVILEEIPLSNPKHLSQGWRYYFVLYCWKIDSSGFAYRGFASVCQGTTETQTFPELSDNIRKVLNILKNEGMVAQFKRYPGSDWVYIWPSAYRNQMTNLSSREGNVRQVWIELNGPGNDVALIVVDTRSKIKTVPKGWTIQGAKTKPYSLGKNARNGAYFVVGSRSDFATEPGLEKMLGNLRKAFGGLDQIVFE